jgi:DEK C terminal domain
MKMSAKAFKLTTPAIKKLIDLLHLDRAGRSTKEDLIDLLLDFLGEPSDELLKSTSPKKKGKTTSGKKRKNAASKRSKDNDEGDDEEEDDDDYDEEEVKRKKTSKKAASSSKSKKAGRVVEDDNAPLVAPNMSEMPSDDILRQWVRAYITVFNMEKATVNHAMEALSEKFGGMDMTSKKPTIRQFLSEEM